MFFDASLHVVGYVGGDNYAILCAAVHGLGVYVVMFGVVLEEPSVLLEGIEVFDGLTVDFWIVFVGARFKVYFGFDDVIERTGVALSFLTGFFGVEHVVGA